MNPLAYNESARSNSSQITRISTAYRFGNYIRQGETKANTQMNPNN